MKTREKILLATIWILLIAWIICAWLFIHEQNKIKENSTYCMDSVRHELWEYLENIHMTDVISSEWVYVYMWGVTYEWTDYSFSCKVYNKENVELKLEQLYDVCEWDTCDVPGTPENIDEPEEFISYYDNWAIREKGTYINGMKQWTWTTYDEEWNIINTEEYKDWKLVNWTENGSEALIIVFSPTGNTKRIATYISEIEGSDLNELIPEIPYTAEDLDYNTNGTRANNEQNDPDARPEIATEFSLDGYDRIYIGYPIWWWTNPKIILTLIEKYDFSGKEIVLFCTSWSSGIGTSESELRGHGLNIIWSKRFAQGASKQEVQEWLESL